MSLKDDVALHSGILVIGSLLWDNQGRKAWRQSRLLIDEKFHVKVPIRYGRISRSRCNTFTMTFGPLGRPGQGVLVPCLKTLSDVSDLVAEAEALWKAEKRDASPSGIGANWGCVGVLFREPKEPLEKEWEKHFRAKASSVWPVNAKGKLSIPWPVPAVPGARTDLRAALASPRWLRLTRRALTPSPMLGCFSKEDTSATSSRMCDMASEHRMTV